MAKLFAMAVPVLPGKTAQWQKFIQELQNGRADEFNRSREQLKVRERTFLQKGPQGDLVIVTLEGEDPEGSFKKFTQQKDPFAQWFLQQVRDIHGIDLAKEQLPATPELLVDSRGGMRSQP